MEKRTEIFLKKQIRPYLIPFIRQYIRYTPYHYGKEKIWTSLIERYVAKADFKYEDARTLFGNMFDGNTQDIIQRYIYYFGMWEPNLSFFMRERLTDGDVFVDVGANIGYFSLLASNLVGKRGSVVAIEASPYIFEKLNKNIVRNKAFNIRPINIAVVDSKKVVTVYKADNGNIGMTNIRENRGFGIECEIEAQPLYAIITAEERLHIRLIKIDVEGAEWDVLQGMQPILNACSPELEVVVEINSRHLERQGRGIEDVFSIFSRYGFNAYIMENDYSHVQYVNPYNLVKPFRIRTKNQIKRQMDVVFSKKDVDCL